MKILLRTLIYCLCIFCVNRSFAGYEEAKISYIQADATKNVFYVFLDRQVSADACNDDHGEPTTNRLLLRQALPGVNGVITPNNFDQLYTVILLAQANDQEIEVLSSKGTCYGGTQNNRYIDGPYIRFRSQ